MLTKRKIVDEKDEEFDSKEKGLSKHKNAMRAMLEGGSNMVKKLLKRRKKNV